MIFFSSWGVTHPDDHGKAAPRFGHAFPRFEIMGSLRGIGYRNGARVQEGGIHLVSQERLHGWGQQGRASVTCAPDSGGMQSLLGVIDPPRRLQVVGSFG